jgi:hypothetical protein
MSDYDVGYGKPPQHSRFKKGQSGNPNGRRPKDARSITRRQLRRDVLNALETEIDASAPGRSGKMSIAEAIIWKQIELAMKGDHKAAKLILELRSEFTEEHAKLHPELMKSLEIAEQKFSDDQSTRLNPHSQKVYNEIRRLTQKV